MSIINQGFDYQEEVIAETFRQWQHNQNVCLVAPTGAGKTVIKSLVAKYFLQDQRNQGYVIAFAHRDVLLSQISLTMAKCGLPHKMLCSRATEREIGNLHMEELGESMLWDRSKIIVASVPTWIKRDTLPLSRQTGLWLMDEFHHTLRDNMWGKALEHMHGARGLGVTATPIRADGKGLGRHAHGIADVLIQTPGMGELIERGNLSPYKVYTVPNDLDVSNINITSSGDYSQIKLAEATKRSHITGDAVDHYRRLAHGKQGIIFAASVDHAEFTAHTFRQAGYNAVALSSKTPILERQHKVNDFKRGRIQLLVNYDLFGEGFDVPAVEVVSMLRKTMSYGLFKQMFGRCLRVLDGKQYGILIDHVGNVREHCLLGKHLHDDPQWTLDDVKKRKTKNSEEDIHTRVCPKCFAFYIPQGKTIAAYKCPECGHQETLPERNAAAAEIQCNEGSLVEYDTGFFKKWEQEKKRVDMSVGQMTNYMSNAPAYVAKPTVEKHAARLTAQKYLRPEIMRWCVFVANNKGLDVYTTQNEFNRVFGVNVYDAQLLGAGKAYDLLDKIKLDILDRMFDKVI